MANGTVDGSFHFHLCFLLVCHIWRVSSQACLNDGPHVNVDRLYSQSSQASCMCVPLLLSIPGTNRVFLSIQGM